MPKHKTPYYRIDDPHSSLSFGFFSEPAFAGAAPRIVPRVVPRDDAPTFHTRERAEQCCALYLRGHVAEIMRVDA